LRTKPFDGLIAAVEPALGHQVLPNPDGIATLAQTQFDRLAKRSHKLVDGTGLRGLRSEALNSTPNPVVTAFSLAGFAVLAFAFPFVERFSGLGLGLTVLAGFAASDPVVTPFSLAGFAGGRRPQAPGGRTPIPAAFR